MKEISRYELKDIDPLKDVLGDGMSDLVEMKDELKDMWHKKQMFRTETEARMSVLNDGKHPTPASKYWQSIREQSAMFDAIVESGFSYRKDTLKLEEFEEKAQAQFQELMMRLANGKAS